MVTLLWIAIPALFVLVLFFISAPKDARNLGAGHGGTGGFGSFAQGLGKGLAEAQALVEPEKGHMLEEMKKDEADTPDEGGPKDPKAGRVRSS